MQFDARPTADQFQHQHSVFADGLTCAYPEEHKSAAIKCHLCISSDNNLNSNLCAACTNKQLKNLQQKYVYERKSTNKLIKHLELRISAKSKLEQQNEQLARLREKVMLRRQQVHDKREKINATTNRINEMSRMVGELMSTIDQRKAELFEDFQRQPIWDTVDEDRLRATQQALIKTKQLELSKAFFDFNLPSLQKYYPNWKLSQAFKFETLKFNNDLNEGFEVISAPDHANPGTTRLEDDILDEDLLLSKKKSKNDFQIIHPLNFSINQNYLEESKTTQACPANEAISKHLSQREDSQGGQRRLPLAAFASLASQSVVLDSDTYVICQEASQDFNGHSVAEPSLDLFIAKNSINPGRGRARGNTQEDFMTADLERSQSKQKMLSQIDTSGKIAGESGASSGEDGTDDAYTLETYITTLNTNDYDLAISHQTDLFSSGGFRGKQNRSLEPLIQQFKIEKRLQRSVHMLCGLLQEISLICCVPLPYKLCLGPFGYSISTHATRDLHHSFPLYLLLKSQFVKNNQTTGTTAESFLTITKDSSLSTKQSQMQQQALGILTEPSEIRDKCRHQIMFEMGILLLDANIRYLLLNHRHEMKVDEWQSCFLDVISLQQQIQYLVLGEPALANTKPAQKKSCQQHPEQPIDVLSISQSKLKGIIDELERIRMPDSAKELANSQLGYPGRGLFTGIKHMLGY